MAIGLVQGFSPYKITLVPTIQVRKFLHVSIRLCVLDDSLERRRPIELDQQLAGLLHLRFGLQAL